MGCQPRRSSRRGERGSDPEVPMPGMIEDYALIGDLQSVVDKW